jgi:hypothetical protein
VQLESANHTTRGVLEELTRAQGQIQYLQEHMEYTAVARRTDATEPQESPTKKAASGAPNIVVSNVQLPLVSAATLNDHNGLHIPMYPGLTGISPHLTFIYYTEVNAFHKNCSHCS